MIYTSGEESIEMKKFAILINTLLMLGIVLLFASCEKNPAEVDEQLIRLPILGAGEYQNIDVQLVGYNTVRVTHKAGPVLRSRDICRIDIGTTVNNQFIRWKTYPSSIDSTSHVYLIHFNFKVKMSRDEIVQILTLRYIKTDSSFVGVETPVPLYKYPYASAQVILKQDDFNIGIFWNIAVNDDFIFNRPLWVDGCLFTYNLHNHALEIMTDNTFQYLAANSHYVFYPEMRMNQRIILHRFNLITGKNDLTKVLNSNIVQGIAADENYVYVLIVRSLKKYTTNFVLQDSIPLDYEYINFMSIKDSVVYFKDGQYCCDPNGEQLRRFDLTSRTWLPNVWSPAQRTEGFDIYKDGFYYVDLNKEFLGVIYFWDLLPVKSGQ